jgi:hypothetical protein
MRHSVARQRSSTIVNDDDRAQLLHRLRWSRLAHDFEMPSSTPASIKFLPSQ